MITNKNSIIRLSRYKNSLYRLKSFGFIKVFSENLADATGVTSSQVRKDFSLFGITGNKKGGYIIDELIKSLNEILGKNVTTNVIVAGAGNIGSALIKYKGFEKENIKILAAFDTDSTKVSKGRDIDVPVLPLEQMSKFIKDNDIMNTKSSSKGFVFIFGKDKNYWDQRAQMLSKIRNPLVVLSLRERSIILLGKQPRRPNAKTDQATHVNNRGSRANQAISCIS